jgi:hypothetical protein
MSSVVYTHRMASTTAPRPSARTRAFRSGDRVVVVGAPGYNPFAIGELGTVYCADRTGAVVTLDSRGIAEVRFATAELRHA